MEKEIARDSETPSTVVENTPSEAGSTHVLQAADVDMQNILHMYESEKEKSNKLESELDRITQLYFQCQNDLKYWQDKCVDQKMEIGLLKYDLDGLSEGRKSKDTQEVKKLKQTIKKLEESHEVLVNSQKSEYDAKIQDFEQKLKSKEDILERIRGTVDSLNLKLDEQKTEASILSNILNLPDNNAMIRFIYNAQMRVNQKLYHDITKARARENETTDAGSSSSSSDGLSSPAAMNHPMFMGMNPMMMPNPGMQLPQYPLY